MFFYRCRSLWNTLDGCFDISAGSRILIANDMAGSLYKTGRLLQDIFGSMGCRLELTAYGTDEDETIGVSLRAESSVIRRKEGLPAYDNSQAHRIIAHDEAGAFMPL